MERKSIFEASFSASPLFLLLLVAVLAHPAHSDPTPARWPEQFHAKCFVNLTNTGELELIDLWYDWPRGRNLNLIQSQLGDLLYDVEWDNGTSYYYTLGAGGSCITRHFPVGVLRPDFLADNSTYLGRVHTAGFLCDLWTKVDFIWYYEDVETRRPVRWDFFTGMSMYVMTFDEGAVLEDSEWQAPAYCFTDGTNGHKVESMGIDFIGLRHLGLSKQI
ncbi:hypothetical protein Cni_G04285 [Canna indica]|uniref:Uncharacterized protein n=1 Tax=Canna indica TaxID=4628 RepID=A0AAQ3JUF5_9LILI|nr:hypothetical protein Cni_G04285 [Canna indica]